MDRKIEIAVGRYREGACSIGTAAELADVSIWRFIDVLEEYEIGVNYAEGDLEVDLRAVGADDTEN